MNLKIRPSIAFLLAISVTISLFMEKFNRLGNDQLVNSRSVNDLDAYAIKLIDSLNPISIEIKRELGSRLVLRDGKFEHTGIILGNESSTIVPRFVQLPVTGRVLGDFHTHADDNPMYAGEHFSPADTTDRLGVSYLGTPKGRILRYYMGVTMEYNRDTNQWDPIAGPIPVIMQLFKEGR